MMRLVSIVKFFVFLLVCLFIVSGVVAAGGSTVEVNSTDSSYDVGVENAPEPIIDDSEASVAVWAGLGSVFVEMDVRNISGGEWSVSSDDTIEPEQVSGSAIPDSGEATSRLRMSELDNDSRTAADHEIVESTVSIDATSSRNTYISGGVLVEWHTDNVPPDVSDSTCTVGEVGNNMRCVNVEKSFVDNTVKSCVKLNQDRGPYGGVGLKDEPEKCVSVSAERQRNYTCSDNQVDGGGKTVSNTREVTFSDYHGNDVSVRIKAKSSIIPYKGMYGDILCDSIWGY